MWYRIINNNLCDYANYKYESDCLETDIITVEEITIHPNKVIVQDGILILNPDYEREEEEKERKRISHLHCTKRVLALILQQLGISYSSLKQLIDSNPQAQLEWDLCVELERSNPLIDIIGEELGLTPTDIDNIFKYANGEINTIQKEGE